MKRLYILVEGQTEEAFIRELLVPHYARIGLFITPILFATSPGHKGGVSSYGKIKSQVTKLSRQDSGAHVSMMIDLYRLPTDTPGRSHTAYPSKGTGSQKSAFIENHLGADIGEPNLIPFVMAHEYEALLFVEPQRFSEWVDSEKTVAALTAIRQSVSSPEDINDGPTTAPSKRIKQWMPEYQKTFHGPLIACDIGLDALRAACPHFDGWLKRLEQLANQSRQLCISTVSA